jgi:hypothetical protein
MSKHENYSTANLDIFAIKQVGFFKRKSGKDYFVIWLYFEEFVGSIVLQMVATLVLSATLALE